MVEEYPELPDFLNRKLNGVVSDLTVTGGRRVNVALPKLGPTKRLKRNVEYRKIYLTGKRGFADGFHTAALVKAGKKYARLLIGDKTIVVPIAVWGRSDGPVSDVQRP